MSPGAIMALAIFFGMLGGIGLTLMMWAKLLNPEQLTIREDKDDPDRLP